MGLNSWCLNNIKEHDAVADVELIGDNLLRVKVKNGVGDGFLILTKSEESSTTDSVNGFDCDSLDFFLNINKDAYIDGNLLRLASVFNFAIGDLGDLFRALKYPNISNYVSPNASYVMRALDQHSRVKRFERLDNRRFRIHRTDLDDVIIIVLYDYIFTPDVIRSAIKKHGRFDAILVANNNCQPTADCATVAANAGFRILNWTQLMSDLHRAW